MINVIRYFRPPNYATVKLCWNSYASVQRTGTPETLYPCGFPAKFKLCSDSNYAEPIKSRDPLIYKVFSNYATMSPYRGAYALHSCQRAPRKRARKQES